LICVHLRFRLRIGAHFLGADARLALVTQTMLGMQMPDGGWNCRVRTNPRTHHSSFHTTFNVLDDLALAARIDNLSQEVFRTSAARALGLCRPTSCIAQTGRGR
jgi:hypothetical protein